MVSSNTKPPPATDAGRLGPAGVALIYAATGAAWIILSDAFLNFAIEDPVLAARIEVAKGLSFVAVTSVVLYALIAVRWRTTGTAQTAEPSLPGMKRQAALLFGAGALTVLLVGIVVFTVEVRKAEAEAFGNLDVIADLKARQIEQWVAGRKGDAEVLAASTGFIGRIAQLQTREDAANRELARNRLAAAQVAYGYETIVVLDAMARPMLSLGPVHDVDEQIKIEILQAWTSDAVQMSGIVRDAGGRMHVDFIAALWQGIEHGREFVGTVLLHADPAFELYPLIQSWPNRSESGETLLVRGEGASVVYLNELRHREGAPLALRHALSEAQLPGAVAVREGRVGHASGTDYRGVRVLFSHRPVFGTDWQIVAKLDRSEALAPALLTAQWVSVVTLFAVALLAIAGLAYARAQRRVDRLEHEREADHLLRHFFNLPFIGMAVTSPRTKRWDRFNDRLCAILGYPREELAQMSWAEMTYPADLDKDVAEFERVMRRESEGYVMEKRFVRKDGAIVDTVIDVKCVRRQDGGVEYFLATIDDVSEDKAAERRLLRLTRLYATLGECNLAIVQCATQDELLDRVCRAMVEKGGMKLAWVGMLGGDGRTVVPVAWHGIGNAADYVKGIRVSNDAQDPFGRGPTGTAMRENEMFWTEDFLNDPRTAPWHERAAAYGWGASGVMPLRRGGVVVGAITAYSGEVGAFDAEMRGLLAEMGNGISLALDNFDREDRRARAEAVLKEQLDELRRWHDATLGREGRILELKREVNDLARQAGTPPRYPSAD